MSDESPQSPISRREMLGVVGRAAAVSVVLPPLLPGTVRGAGPRRPGTAPLRVVAGPDRVVMATGRTYVNAWAGYGEPPGRGRRRWGEERSEPEETGPEPSVAWTKVSGPGAVDFEDPRSLVTTATFSALGTYVLELAADNGETVETSTFEVRVEEPPPAEPLAPVYTTRYRVHDGLWGRKVKALMVNWIPHCIEMIERDDLELGPGGIDNFVEAAKALRGEPHGEHKGYVFSNAWVHQTVESMCIALMIDAEGDPEILEAQATMRATLEDWIPKILAAREPDGYLHTAYTLRDREEWPTRWTPEGRRHHEGYVQGYFIESAINHYMMTGGEDTRLYDAARELADTWADHIGPPPRQPWFDGHQEMEQALVRFGHFVNEVEKTRDGDRYIDLAKFLLDCREGGSPYDQSHLPVVQQYEAVGHAVRAVYQYSAMADVAIETGDVDYQSAVRSL